MGQETHGRCIPLLEADIHHYEARAEARLRRVQGTGCGVEDGLRVLEKEAGKWGR